MATNMQVVTPGRRRRGWAAVLALLALILVSCAACTHRGTTVGGPGVYGKPPQGAANVKITQLTVGDVFPTEGSVTFVQLTTPAGATLLTKQLPSSQKLTLPLNPGTYRLVTWQRTCDANCGNLDPPSDRCARPITVTPNQQLNVTIRVNFASGCVIETSG